MIKDKIAAIVRTLPATTRLVAVSKYHPDEAILEAYDAGQRVFGESKVQELVGKHDRLPSDVEWHFIGHLQTNKVKYIVPFIALIHSIDSFKLLAEVDKQASKINRRVDCLLQLHVAQEESKFGFTSQECREMLAEGEWKQLRNVRICGVMGMATNTDDDEQIMHEFCLLSEFFKECQSTWFKNEDSFRELSMGMSDDYPLAVQAGSTLIRVGSSIFGERDYSR